MGIRVVGDGFKLRTMNRLLLLLSVVFLTFGRARAHDVPAFTPNVVQTADQLPDAEVREINAAIEKIRNEAGIWGAVYILDTLNGESIEAVATQAFNTWVLGEKGKNNGLLLVLALKDRRSRFEVGYGLEGDIPDLIAKRALDEVMRPLLRQGETKKAIIDGFKYLAAVHMKSPDAEAYLPAKVIPSWTSTGELLPRRGLVVLGVYLLVLWLCGPIAKARARYLARRLEAETPEYRYAEDTYLNGGTQKVVSPLAAIGLRLFLSLNPGAFIFIGAGFVFWLALALPTVALLIALAYFRSVTSRYRSAETYRAFIAKARKANAAMVAKGYMTETRPGVFTHTPAWFTSDEYREQQSRSRSSSGSSSSSSSSSSSGGGSSGGGGASSSW